MKEPQHFFKWRDLLPRETSSRGFWAWAVPIRRFSTVRSLARCLLGQRRLFWHLVNRREGGTTQLPSLAIHENVTPIQVVVYVRILPHAVGDQEIQHLGQIRVRDCVTQLRRHTFNDCLEAPLLADVLVQLEYYLALQHLIA